MSAKAFIGNNDIKHVFAFNPETVEWGYQENIHSQDTLGGRVVQLLSVQVTTMTLMGSAGSRKELQQLATDIKQIMKWHIDKQLPVRLKVPSRKWDFLVYVQDLPRIGWDVYATNYPFQLSLAVDHDMGIKTDDILGHQLDELAKGIGYDPAVHGGDPSAFQEIVSKLAANWANGGPFGGGGGTGKGSSGGSGGQVGTGNASNKNATYIANNVPSCVRPEWRPFFDRAGKQYNIDPRLLALIALQECSLGNCGCNDAGYGGIMQIPCSVKNWQDPWTNIRHGAAILRGKMNSSLTHNLTESVAAYNAGQGNISAGLDYAHCILHLYFNQKGPPPLIGGSYCHTCN